MSETIAAHRLLGANGIVEDPLVTMEDGYITGIHKQDRGKSGSSAAPESATYRFADAVLVPAYLDIHVHGAAGHDVMEGTPEGFEAIQSFFAKRGVGGFFPTTVTAPLEETLYGLAHIADEIERPPSELGAVPLGIHLEGPFLSHAKPGVHSVKLLAQPSITLFDRFWQASRGLIRLMTIAPELDDALELIEYATRLGVRCSLGHSDATVAQAEAGFRAGGRSATHTFNAMRSLDHRDPGIAAYVLDNGDLFAEIVCDGKHVDPMMVRLFYKGKGSDRSILITDGISATGMPEGKYKLAHMVVEVADGRCLFEGKLAGSVLTLDQAVRNFAAFTGTDLLVPVRLASYNPAKLMNLENTWGVLAEGRQANMAVLSPDGQILQSFRAGRPVLT